MKILLLILFPLIATAQTYEINNVSVNLERFREITQTNKGKYYSVLKARKIVRKYLNEVNLDYMDHPGIVIYSTMFDHSVGWIKNDTIKVMLWGELRTFKVSEDRLIVTPLDRELQSLFYGNIEMARIDP